MMLNVKNVWYGGKEEIVNQKFYKVKFAMNDKL